MSNLSKLPGCYIKKGNHQNKKSTMASHKNFLVQQMKIDQWNLCSHANCLEFNYAKIGFANSLTIFRMNQNLEIVSRKSLAKMSY